MSAASVSPMTDWFYSLFWSAFATGLPVFAMVLFVLGILTHSIARSVVISFVVLYVLCLALSVTIIVLMMKTSAGGVMTYPTALAQMGLTYLFARIVNDIVKGSYDQLWFMDLYYRLADRYFPSLDGSKRTAPAVRYETDGIDDTDSLSPAYAPVAAFRGRHAAPVSNRSAA